MEYTKRLLVIRLSALGDVAILQPVLRHWALANPDVQFLLAAPPMLAPLFSEVENVLFVPTVKKQSVRAIHKQLSLLKPTMVVDMHHVLRTIGVDFLFHIQRIPVRSIRKRGHAEMTSWQRYNEVFMRCGLNVAAQESLQSESEQYWTTPIVRNRAVKVGVAPFATHEGKIWPSSHTEALLRSLSQSGKYNVVLFGSKAEAEVLEHWAKQFSGVESIAGKHSFEEELSVISSLDVMVSMDSSNMHFASCLGVPVVSVWGATHPCRGFYGWRQNPAWAVQVDMACRPCSKYGNKRCKYGDYPCLKAVTPEMVLDKIESVIS